MSPAAREERDVMVDRAVRWAVIVAALVVFVLLKSRLGLPIAAGVTLLVLLLIPTALHRLGSGRRDRPRD